MSFVDLTDGLYADLNQYAILTNGELSASAGVITVNSGFRYGSPITGAGNFINGTTPSGVNSTLRDDAFADLLLLKAHVQAVITTLPDTVSIGAGGSNYTFESRINYTGTGITYEDKTLTFDADNNPDAQFFITSSSAMTFTDCTFVLANGAKACNIFWRTDPTTLTGEFTAINSSVPGIILATAEVTFINNAAPNMTLTGHIFVVNTLVGSTPAITFTQSGAGALRVNALTCPEVICYAKGTKILTKNGYVAVEDLRAGDFAASQGIIDRRHITYTRSPFKRIKWVKSFSVYNLTPASTPICIKAGALGENKPSEDLYVSPDHGIVIDNKLISAKYLVNGKNIVQEYNDDSITYYHVELPAHSVIIANGVAAESYKDTGNRYMFQKRVEAPRIKKRSLFPMSR